MGILKDRAVNRAIEKVEEWLETAREWDVRIADMETDLASARAARQEALAQVNSARDELFERFPELRPPDVPVGGVRVDSAVEEQDDPDALPPHPGDRGGGFEFRESPGQ